MNTSSRKARRTSSAALVPIPTGVVPLPVRLPCCDQQPAPQDAERMLEAMTIALGTHGFTMMGMVPEHSTINRQLVTVTMLAYRPQYDTSLMVTIKYTQRYGLVAIARWTMTDGHARRREPGPIGFELDAATTSTSLAYRIARTLAVYEARVCALPAASSVKRAA